MLDRLEALKEVLGSYKAVADHLGYSERHLLNIRKCLMKGKPLPKRVDSYISSVIDHFGLQVETTEAIETVANEEKRSWGNQMLQFPNWE